jgi:hypothetical protein
VLPFGVKANGKGILISLSHWERAGVRAYGRTVNPNSFFVVECHLPSQRTRKIRSAHKPSSPALLPEGEGRNTPGSIV